MPSNRPLSHDGIGHNTRHSTLPPTKDVTVCFILETSPPNDPVMDALIPFGSAFIGGFLALLGALLQGYLVERHAKKARRRELSVESARNVDIQLVKLQHLIRDQGYLDAHGFDQAAYEQIALITADMELHRRYIDDSDLQESIKEATEFLHPYGGFEDLTGDTPTGVVRNITRGLRPMIQSHVLDKEPPPEPSYVDTYRKAHAEARDKWERFWSDYDRMQSPND